MGVAPYKRLMHNDWTALERIINDLYRILNADTTLLDLATPPGSDGEVIYNDGGTAYGADSTFSFNDSTKVLTAQVLKITSVAASSVDTDKFLVDDSDEVKFRTGAEVLSDIGGSASGHLHDGATLQHDGVNSDGGAFPFTTTGLVTFNQSIAAAGITVVNAINEFSTDGTMGGDSDSAVPTEKAVKLYTDTLRSDLASVANAKGASLVGVEDSAAQYDATDVEAALSELMVLVTPVEYNPTMTRTVGGDAGGDDDSVATIDDADSYDTDELAATPGSDVQAVFSGVVDFNQVQIHTAYDGNPAHIIRIDLDKTPFNWSSFDTILADIDDNSGNFIFNAITVASAGQYINSGEVRLRFYHSSAGNATHDFFIDYCALWKTGASVGVTEHGGLSGLLDDDHNPLYLRTDGTRALSGAWDMGSQNLTNVVAVDLAVTNACVLGSDSTVFQPNADSTTFFQVKNAAGTGIAGNFDTTNIRLGVGTDTPLGVLHIKSGAGQSSPTAEDDIIIEKSGVGNIRINLIGNTSSTHGFIFSDTTRAVGGVEYEHSGDTFAFVAGGSRTLNLNKNGVGELIGNQPRFTLHDRVHEDADGGRDSWISFTGEQSGGEETTLARIAVSHDGDQDDQKGKLIGYINTGADGDSPTQFLEVGSDLLAQFAGAVLVDTTFESTGVATLADGSTMKTSAAPGADAEIANKKYVEDNAGVAAHAMLDGSVHTDSVADAVTRGSLIYGNSTPKWDELVIGTGFLNGNGTDCAWLSYADTMDALSGTAGATFTFNSQSVTGIGALEGNTGQFNQSITTGYGLAVYRDLASGSTTAAVVLMQNDNAGDDQVVLEILQDCPANAITTTGNVSFGNVHAALKSGANQGAAGAAAGELWHDTDDDTVKMGV